MNIVLNIDTETGSPVFYGKPLTFNEARHQYKWDGEAVPSVTTILQRLAKPALIQWAANCAVDYISENLATQFCNQQLPELFESARRAHLRIRDAAGDVGTLVHKIAQKILGEDAIWSADEKIIPIEAQNALYAFMEWRHAHDIEPIGLERRIFSKKFGYAGTCDFVGKIDGRLAVLDFKTGGKTIYDEAWLQTAAYLVAIQEEIGAEVEFDRWVVHLDKTTGKCTPEIRPEHMLFTDRSAWMLLVSLHHALTAMAKQKKK